MVGGPNPSSAESSSWLIRSVTRDEVEDSSAEEIRVFNNKLNKLTTKTTPKEKNKQAGRQAEDWSTVKHLTHMT